MLRQSAKLRLRAAARPGQRTRQVLDTYAEIVNVANNHTGIAKPPAGELEQRLGLSRWTLRRHVAILKTAGVVVTRFLYDKRGYRSGIEYRLLPGDPAAYGAEMPPHVRTRSQNTKNVKSTAPSAPPSPAGGPTVAGMVEAGEPVAADTVNDEASIGIEATAAASSRQTVASVSKSDRGRSCELGRDRGACERLARRPLAVASSGMLQKTVWEVAKGARVLELEPVRLAGAVRMTLYGRRMKPTDDEAIPRAIEHVQFQQKRLEDQAVARGAPRDRSRRPVMPGPRFIARRVVAIPTDAASAAALTWRDWAEIDQQYKKTTDPAVRTVMWEQIKAASAAGET